jgi:hypothetical protein
MSPSVLLMWPELRWRLDEINDRHAHVSVFDHGAHAGTLTLDRATWNALSHYGARCVSEKAHLDAAIQTTVYDGE